MVALTSDCDARVEIEAMGIYAVQQITVETKWPSGSTKLKLAHRHLERVQGAWDEPTDWDDLSLYGFYCLEAAVEAAALHVGLRTSKQHWEKVDLAVELHRNHDLPDVTDLLRDLNDARKAAAYGDVEQPDLDAEDLASVIERYVDAVAALLGDDDE